MDDFKERYNEVYGKVNEFLKKYPLTITWRIRQHSKVLAKHLNEDEEIIYTFPAQKNDSTLDIFSTVILAFTNKRILMAQKNLLWGYKLFSITPDMFNDFEVFKALIFGKLEIDTVKEVIRLSDLDPKSLIEIETNLSEYLLEIKPKYVGKSESN